MPTTVDLDSYLPPSRATASQGDRRRPGASPTDIQAHYDLGNDFYRLWLDDSMTYSAALWSPDDTSAALEIAQQNKIDYHVDQVIDTDAEASTMRALDCGCGWGAVLGELSNRSAVREAVGITLSRAQVEWISQRGFPKVEARLESWQQHEPETPYDAIIACGVLEHAADPDLSVQQKIQSYTNFFQRCRAWSRSGSRLSLQFIAHGSGDDKLRARVTSLTEQVFPGTALPRLQEVIAACEELYRLDSLRNDARDYARTCHLWRSRLRAQEATIVERYGHETYQRYARYLLACELGFLAGNLALYRATLTRNRD